MNIVRFVMAAVISAGVVATGSPSAAQEVSLLMVSALPAEHPSSRAMEILKAEAVHRSNDAIHVELYTGMKFGGPGEIVQQVRTGAIFAVWLPPAYISRIVPEIEVVNLPFVFNRFDDVLRAVDGPAGKVIEAKLADKGFTTLAWMEYGARHVMNAKRPLRTLDDFKDLRLHVQPLEILHATFRKVGTTPVTLNPKDIYTSLKQGDVEGAELPYSISNSYGFYEKQKYLSDTNDTLDPVILIAGKKAFTGLSPEHQKVIRDAAGVAAVQERKMVTDAEVAALADLRAKGLQFDPLPHETRRALHQVAAGVIDSMKGPLGTELVDMVMAGREAEQ
jgi:TRAP-type C4-dicarboxylate transport system substrate-binding protein